MRAMCVRAHVCASACSKATVRALHRQPTLDAAPRMTEGPLPRIFTGTPYRAFPLGCSSMETCGPHPVIPNSYSTCGLPTCDAIQSYPVCIMTAACRPKTPSSPTHSLQYLRLANRCPQPASPSICGTCVSPTYVLLYLRRATRRPHPVLPNMYSA